ncbi:hypothetical protein TNCV_3604971 [Trichonephila clavipes]|nr:hypothetical protein TNCV_3604971 [Trichonephila clavipes]
MKKLLLRRRLVSSNEEKAASLRMIAKNDFQLYWQKGIVGQRDYFQGGCTSVLGTTQGKLYYTVLRTFRSYNARFSRLKERRSEDILEPVEIATEGIIEL